MSQHDGYTDIWAHHKLRLYFIPYKHNKCSFVVALHSDLHGALGTFDNYRIYDRCSRLLLRTDNGRKLTGTYPYLLGPFCLRTPNKWYPFT